MRGRWRSAREGQQQAKRVWLCLACNASSEVAVKRCLHCDSRDKPQMFGSRTEFERGAHLNMLRKIGRIERLKFQPRFDLSVNGRHVTTYVADACYYEEGRLIVEDTKPVKYMTEEAKLKIALFNALHPQTQVLIVRG